MNTFDVRQLVAGDEALFRALRLAGLETDPEAFGSTLDREAAWPIERYIQMLENSHVVGVFSGSALAGAAGYYRLDGNMAHRGHLWGVIVDRQFRGHGVGSKVIEAIISHARHHVAQLHLGVGAYNAPAIALYQKAGFTIYGTEPRALFVNGKFIDEHLMVRFLDQDDSTGESNPK